MAKVILEIEKASTRSPQVKASVIFDDARRKLKKLFSYWVNLAYFSLAKSVQVCYFSKLQRANTCCGLIG
jgi:hypothetical protein